MSIPLTDPSQLKKGLKLKIVGKNKDRDSYESVTIKDLLYNEESVVVEVIINKRRNYYFIVESYLGGTSWAESIEVLD